MFTPFGKQQFLQNKKKHATTSQSMNRRRSSRHYVKLHFRPPGQLDILLRTRGTCVRCRHGGLASLSLQLSSNRQNLARRQKKGHDRSTAPQTHTTKFLQRSWHNNIRHARLHPRAVLGHLAAAGVSGLGGRFVVCLLFVSSFIFCPRQAECAPPQLRPTRRSKQRDIRTHIRRFFLKNGPAGLWSSRACSLAGRSPRDEKKHSTVTSREKKKKFLQQLTN
jgi:hypothetical protein